MPWTLLVMRCAPATTGQEADDGVGDGEEEDVGDGEEEDVYQISLALIAGSSAVATFEPSAS